MCVSALSLLYVTRLHCIVTADVTIDLINCYEEG